MRHLLVTHFGALMVKINNIQVTSQEILIKLKIF
jgi:hypothetical protein